ncbi:hypothetical protein JCM3774_006838 [Rhodotorula dairenensis]
MAADDAAQRTLLVLFAPESHLGAPYARRILSAAGLVVIREDKLSGEELEEAGLDVDGGASGDQFQLPSHIAMIVQGTNAVACLRDLRIGTLASQCPTLRTFAAPSLDAASMAIEILFPCLDSVKDEPPAASASTTAHPEAAPKPFALSNAAFEAKQQEATASAPPAARKLSPAIEKALAEVEAREEQQRLRKLSRGSRGSAGGTPSPLASRDISGDGTDAESTFERRVFTLVRSPSPEPESEPEPETTAANAVDGVAQDEGAGTQTCDLVQEPVPDAEASMETAPLRSRVSSAQSNRSKASSTRPVAAAATTTTTSTAGFKARPAPSLASKPSIQPRMTKAAALRLGIALPPPPAPATPRRSALASPSMDPAAGRTPQSSSTPGPTLRSLAEPTITPRLTKTAALRLGQSDPTASSGRDSSSTTTPRVRQSISTAERAALDRARRQSALGAAGSLSAATSAPAPRVEVKMSRAALLRQGLEAGQGPRTNARSATSGGGLGSSMSAAQAPARAAAAGRRSIVSADLKALREPAVAPRMTKAASLRAGAGAGSVPADRAKTAASHSASDTSSGSKQPPRSSLSLSRTSASSVSRPASRTGSSSSSRALPPPRLQPRNSPTVSSSSTTTSRLTPRPNKAAELRERVAALNKMKMKKKEEEEEEEAVVGSTSTARRASVVAPATTTGRPGRTSTPASEKMPM